MSSHKKYKTKVKNHSWNNSKNRRKITIEKEKNNTDSRVSYKASSKELYIKYLSLPLYAVFLIFVYFNIFYTHFYSLEIELGNPLPSLSYFLKNDSYLNNSELLTDMNEIDNFKEGVYFIDIKYKNRIETVTLTVEDTIAPDVTFKDLTVSKDYIFNVNDFIEEINDKNKTAITHSFNEETVLEYDEYNFTIEVTDTSGNKTEGNVTLKVTPILPEYILEYGETIKINDFVVDESLYNQIDDQLIDEINNGKVNDVFEISVTAESKKYFCKVRIADTTPPDLILKDVKVYIDTKPNAKMEDFVVSKDDFSGIKTISLLTEIDNNKIGEQEITIEAIDNYGNRTVKTCLYLIKADDDGPEFTGLNDAVIEKYEVFDFEKDVTAYDFGDKENTDFEVDISSFDNSKPGDYFVAYTTTDKSGNITNSLRRITVNPDLNDENELFTEFYNEYLINKKPEEMARIIQNRIGYNNSYGGDYPVYYGLTTMKGNCYVHTMMLKKAFDTAGIENMIIHTIDESHFWNLAKTDETWAHYESTPNWPFNGPMNDMRRRNQVNSDGIYMVWDKELYPECK